MKKFLLIICILITGMLQAKAQDGEKIKALKIAFITQRLQLTPEQAQKFWPIYNQYDNELRSAQLDESDPNVLDKDKRVLAIKEKYMGQFQKVLGPQKTNMFFNSERDFRGLLIRRLQNRNQLRMNQLRR